MNRPPQAPRQTPSASPSANAAAPPRPSAFSRAPQANVAQPKTQEPQTVHTDYGRGAGSGGGGSIQAHVIGGTRALHARLVSMHAAEQRASASRAATQG